MDDIQTQKQEALKRYPILQFFKWDPLVPGGEEMNKAVTVGPA